MLKKQQHIARARASKNFDGSSFTKYKNLALAPAPQSWLVQSVIKAKFYRFGSTVHKLTDGVLEKAGQS